MKEWANHYSNKCKRLIDNYIKKNYNLFLPNGCNTSYKTEGCTYFSMVDIWNIVL